MPYKFNLKSDYINIINFLKAIQYYDVTLIAQCMEVKTEGDKSNSKKDKKSKGKNYSVIIPLNKSGLPLKSTCLL